MLPYRSDDNSGDLRAPAEFTQQEAPKVITNSFFQVRETGLNTDSYLVVSLTSRPHYFIYKT